VTSKWTWRPVSCANSKERMATARAVRMNSPLSSSLLRRATRHYDNGMKIWGYDCTVWTKPGAIFASTVRQENCNRICVFLYYAGDVLFLRVSPHINDCPLAILFRTVIGRCLRAPHVPFLTPSWPCEEITARSKSVPSVEPLISRCLIVVSVHRLASERLRCING
jgi:hypothetical protein